MPKPELSPQQLERDGHIMGSLWEVILHAPDKITENVSGPEPAAGAETAQTTQTVIPDPIGNPDS